MNKKFSRLKKFFPRSKSELRQMKLLGNASTVAASLLIITLFVSVGIQHALLRSSNVAAVVSAVLVDLANTDRASNQLGGLTINPVLVAAAQAKANDMAAKGYFAHVSPDGHDSWYWFKQAGYSFNYAGENLAVDFSDSVDVNTAWMNSQSHRANILDPHFTEVGIALSQGMYAGHPTTFVVQMFGTPSSVASPTRVTEVTTPKKPTDIAIATTNNAAPPPTRVLGEAAKEQSAPIAQAKHITAQTPQTQVVEKASYAPLWGYLVASPKTTLKYTYYIIGLLVIFALFVTADFEYLHHHIKKFIIASSLLFLMCGLFVVADRMFGDTIIAGMLLVSS